MKIEYEKGVTKYYDMNGDEIHEGDYVVMSDEKIEKVYRTEDGYLGIDATNPSWIGRGLAVPCEYGVYPFEPQNEPVLIKELK